MFWRLLLMTLAGSSLYLHGSLDAQQESAIKNSGVRRPLTAIEQKRFESGKTVYEMTCIACHQHHGNGQEGLAPPLAGSEWVNGSEERLIRMVLNGLRGPITVKKQAYEMEMPPSSILDDEQIASVLTYVRREWENAAAPVEATAVKGIRDATASREEAWTAADLLKIP